MSAAKPFELAGATVHFVYSFLPVSKANGLEMVLRKETLDEILEAWKTPQANLGGAQGDFGKPDERHGITPFLDLALQMGFVRWNEVAGSLPGMALSASTLVRLFPLGSSSCVKVKVIASQGASLTLGDVQRVLACVKLKDYDPPSPRPFGLGASEVSVFELCRHHMKSSINPRGPSSEEDAYLLCEDHVNKDNPEPQTPWVVVVLKAKGRALEKFCGSFAESPNPSGAKDEAISEYETQIAPLLFHAAHAGFQVEPMYVRPPYPGAKAAPYNLNVEAGMFVSMSRRAILCICADEKADPAKYFLPALLDLVEVTRARWQALVVLNKVLDEAIGNFRIEKALLEDRKKRQDRAKKIIGLADRLSSSLVDPGTYLCSGGGLRVKQTIEIVV
jgi:hypothetical protein